MPVNDELLRRVKEELEAEGEDENSIWNRAYESISQIVERIAKKLSRAVKDIWEALKRLGGG